MLLKYIIILIFILSIAGYSQTSVSIPNITVKRGDDFLLPIEIKGYNNNFDNLELELQYDARLLGILNVFGGIKYIIQDSIVTYSTELNFEDLKSSRLIISSKTLKNSLSNTLCVIEFEALASTDTLASAIPLRLILNGIEVENLDFQGAEIIVQNPIFIITKNSIGMPFPNPSNHKFTLPILLENESRLQLKLFNSLGKRLGMIPVDNNLFDFALINEQGLEVEFTEDKLAKGNYKLEVVPKKWKMSSGVYHLVVKIDSEVFKTNLMFTK